MKAVQLTDYGSVDNFRVVDVPKPSPAAGEVLVKVAFAGLGWGDIMGRHGDPVRRFTAPFEDGIARTLNLIDDEIFEARPTHYYWSTYQSEWTHRHHRHLHRAALQRPPTHCRRGMKSMLHHVPRSRTRTRASRCVCRRSTSG